MSQRPIYLDCHATTPMDKRVLEAMLPYFTEHFGNPSSINHFYGWEAEAAVKKARETIANAVKCNPEEIIFTSGATEANNLAVKGIAEAYFNQGQHIITVQTEHRAVLDPCKYLEKLGFKITYLPVQKDGIIDLKFLEKSIRNETILVSVMAANNEIGVLQPLKEIGDICKKNEVLFHSDAAQAIGKIPLDVQNMNIDLLSLTAHKIYGPKGVGVLYIRRRNPRVNIASQLHGGGQERAIRSGTLYTPQIVGFGKAIELALAEIETENKRQSELRNRLQEQLLNIEGVSINGHLTKRLPNNLNVSIEGVDGAALLLGLQGIVALSSGSACTSTTTKPSHVLKALGHSDKLAYASLRFGLGRFTTSQEIDTVAQQVVNTIQSLRQAIVNTKF
ncbi:IscS subfamily cysteine desulfurase [Crocosphaera chwakensis]|uniref:cysteine desulfurase n=1 Tax=Crocosphaera chwakensis CCY0110 TaxID=391612 RepID=A3IGR5_9CHRO|nr:IscS subfamily cysteine desulfurase [Crocosphaera chwakensis]EAZ94157.1 Aromatic amino acid beta-eliminating lyase/threonine aldolase [Crocosphaera chwakensis CCY0110]